MIGVVLWSDSTKNRAVIWCEDHGDLAFYRTDSDDSPRLQDGDCVVFDVELDGDLRHAKDLTLLEEETHPSLAAYLVERDRISAKILENIDGIRQPEEETADPVESTATGELIPFPARRRTKRNATGARSTCRVVHVS